MNRGPLARRYWFSLTGAGHGPTPQRNWRGQTFWRRYLASFFVLPQPPAPPSQAKNATARALRTSVDSAPDTSAGSQPATRADSAPDTSVASAPATSIDSAPQHPRPPRARIFRFQPALLGGMAVLVVAVVAVTQLKGGNSPSSGGPNPHPSNGGPQPTPQTTTSSPSAKPPTTSASPTKVETWQGTIRVNIRGEQVTAGPSPVAGLLFGLEAPNQTTLNGPGNLAQWTQDGDPTAAGCLAALQAHAVNQVTVQVGDQVCIAALDGRTAVGKVTAEDTDVSNGTYIELAIVAYP